jgi:hypothetical protein
MTREFSSSGRAPRVDGLWLVLSCEQTPVQGTDNIRLLSKWNLATYPGTSNDLKSRGHFNLPTLRSLLVLQVANMHLDLSLMVVARTFTER